jgi:protein-tyrosine-phosphatase
MKVLFVCDGNICRSPLAVSYLRHRAEGEGIRNLAVDSAGLLGIEGSPAAPFSVDVARDAGLDLTSHRSRGVSAADMRSSDWVFGMTNAHLEALERRFPAGGERRLLLRAFEGGPVPAARSLDLDDPITSPIEAYREAFAIMRICLDHFVSHLRHAG